MENTKIRCMPALKALVTSQCNGKLLQARIPTIPQLGWEVYKEKQEVMPGITKGHFPFDWNDYLNGPRSAMRPGGGRGRQSVSQIKPITCGLHTDFETCRIPGQIRKSSYFVTKYYRMRSVSPVTFISPFCTRQAKSLTLLA